MSELVGKLESEKIAEENLVCRDIVKEVVKFGVNQRQLLYIIRLLAFELEDVEQCREIVATLDFLGGTQRVIDMAENGGG